MARVESLYIQGGEMNKGTIKNRLQCVGDLLMEDPKWEELETPTTQAVMVQYITENRPDVVALLATLSREEVRDKGFIIAMLCFSSLMAA